MLFNFFFVRMNLRQNVKRAQSRPTIRPKPRAVRGREDARQQLPRKPLVGGRSLRRAQRRTTRAITRTKGARQRTNLWPKRLRTPNRQRWVLCISGVVCFIFYDIYLIYFVVSCKQVYLCSEKLHLLYIKSIYCTTKIS